MKINIGTENQVKVSAFRDVIADYAFFKNAAVNSVKAGSGVADQPKSLAQTVRGAKNRARAAAKFGDIGVGIEDGLIKVPQTLTGFMNTCVCALYDGKRYYLGMSAAFEYPPEAVKLVKKGLDINQAFYKL
jgi:inosine/xanthosine triphosphatase